MAQINIAGYGRKYKNPVNTSSARSPIRRIASALPSITKQAIYESVTDPMSMLPDLYNVPSDNTSDTASPGFQGNPSRGAIQDEADSIMSNAMGFGPSGIAKKAASLGWNAITSPFTMGVPFAESVADIGFGAVNANQNAMALGDIMTQNEAVTPSAVNSVFKGQYSDQLGAIAPFANNEKGMQSLKSLTALSDKANFDKAHPILGFFDDTVVSPIKNAVRNVFGETTESIKTPTVSKPMTWSEETNPTDLSVVESITKGHTAMSGIGKKGIPTFQQQTLDPKTNTYSNVGGNADTDAVSEAISAVQSVGFAPHGLGLFGIGPPNAVADPDPFSLGVTDVEAGGTSGASSGSSSPGNSSSTGGVGDPAGTEGAGGAGGTVLCTELNRQGILSDELYRADQLYSKTIKMEIVSGYHIWAEPVARSMKTSRIVTMIMKPFVMGWAKHAAYKMDATSKDSMFGLLIELIGKPICLCLNYLKEGYQDGKKLAV